MAQESSETQDVYRKDGSAGSEASVRSPPCGNTFLEDSGLRAEVEEIAFQVLSQQSLMTNPHCTLQVNEPQEDNYLSSLTFPRKLWKIVESGKFKSIWWDEEGTSIVINEELFKKEILERKAPFRIFETNSMKSLIRQLNLYGFSKVQQNFQRSASLADFLAEEKEISTNLTKLQFYHNPNFRRGHPHLLLRMKRRIGVRNASPVTASLLPELSTKFRTESNVDNHNCDKDGEASEQSLFSASAKLNVPLINKASTGQGITSTNHPIRSDLCPPSSGLIRPSEQMPPGQHSALTHSTTFYMHSLCSYSQANGNTVNVISTSSSQFQIISPLQNTHFGLPMEHGTFQTGHPNCSANQSRYSTLLPADHPWLPTPNKTNPPTASQSTATYQLSSVFQQHPTDKESVTEANNFAEYQSLNFMLTKT